VSGTRGRSCKEHLLLELVELRHEHDAERVARALAEHTGFLARLRP
jgi:hypothetical protein